MHYLIVRDRAGRFMAQLAIDGAPLDLENIDAVLDFAAMVAHTFIPGSAYVVDPETGLIALTRAPRNPS